ncbi:hypothetical protein [Candidatus Poriferisodalis sp.]|uniref:hypothetical protein n=1 Tax=Candidatus Poriferisodalis sp. TaxID=3101277 RepID=UPI003B023B9B
MTSPAEHDSSIPPDTGAQGAAASAAPAAALESRRGREAARRTVSPNVVISVLGGFIAALLTALSALMVVQFNSLGNRIDNLGTELRAEMASLRAETQAGFREVNAILLDHTERLARLEAAAGLPPPTTLP